MHQHEHEQEHPYASTAAGLHVLVHTGLRALFDSPHAPLSTLRIGLNRVEFVGGEKLTAPGEALELPVLLPVTSESQAEELRTVRMRHPLSLIIAVTNDLSGHLIYHAIRSGSNFAFNLAISSESQIDMLYAQFRAHSTTMAAHTAPDAPDAPHWASAHTATPRIQRVLLDHNELHPGADNAVRQGPQGRGGPVLREGGRRDPAALPALSDYDTELMRLLCTSITVSEIARRHYCSERSMYRRVRKLYDLLGVTGRAELTALVSASGTRTRRPFPDRRAC
ncbi:helix-turn-helix transcriptional regulator [Streptomyces sp. NPDC001514]